MGVVTINDQTFAQDTENGTVLVDFYAPWCGPCKQLAPVLEEVSQEVGDKIKICKVNVDENQEHAGKFGVMSIPTLLVFKDGQMLAKATGSQSKEDLLNWVKPYL